MDAFIDTLKQVLTYTLFSVGDADIKVGGILQFVLIIIVAWWLSKLSQSGLQRVSHHRGMSPASLYTLKRLLHYSVITIGFAVAVGSLGIDLTKFAIFASALGIGAGFGLQTLISNFTAGLMLLFEKTLKVGDFIELSSGLSGEVKEIKIRSTIITTTDNIDIVVPNAEFVNGRVTNWTMRDTYRRVRIGFSVAYGTDKQAVKEAVLAAAERVPHTLTDDDKRKPQVWLVEFADSALNFELAVWLTPAAVKRPAAVQAAFLWEIHSALEAAQIEIPFPQRDLHIKSWSRDATVPEQVRREADEDDKTEQDKTSTGSNGGNDAAEEL